ncbi:MAG: hypothetical protein LAT68_10515 [Cyclobacteriaceae bacterium]|nr:hypothetical protein [Cyclobacteriaceae bacterium]MCH8516748.1 hypothetical protein [Cyclobacteriaceae bacterium]
MESLFQIILYVVVVIGYYLLKHFGDKKKKEELERRKQEAQENIPVGEGEPKRNTTSNSNRPKTFEEILMEMSGMDLEEESVEKETVQKEEQPKKSERNRNDDYWKRYSQESTRNREQSFRRDTTEKPQPVASEYEKYTGTGNNFKVEEIDLDKLDEIKFLKEDPADSEVSQGTSNRYANLLKSNPNSLKDAIVLQEILNRRHF